MKEAPVLPFHLFPGFHSLDHNPNLMHMSEGSKVEGNNKSRALLLDSALSLPQLITSIPSYFHLLLHLTITCEQGAQLSR